MEIREYKHYDEREIIGLYWSHRDDKERTMAHRTRTKSKARTAAAVDADMASLRREREGLAAELAGMRAERDRLFCFNVFSAGSSVFFRSVGGWFSPVSSSCSQ